MKACEGVGTFWATACPIARWTDIRSLNLVNCGLSALPAAIGALTTLRVLRVSHNKLTVLPTELGQLHLLEMLAADANLLTAVPGVCGEPEHWYGQRGQRTVFSKVECAPKEHNAASGR